jgi:long-chain acyl-CoA synthetase
MTDNAGRWRTVSELLLDGARYGSNPAFVMVSAADNAVESTLSFADAVDRGRRIVGTLRAAGLEPGGRVLIAAEPSIAWITTFIGTILAGGVAVPINHRYRQREFETLIAAAGPAVIVHDSRTASDMAAALESGRRRIRMLDLDHDRLDAGPVHEATERSADDLAVILHTSGTTGVPKGVERTHGDYARFAHWWSSQAMNPTDRVLNFLPLYHQSGLACSFLSAFAQGIPIFQLDRFDRRTFWDTVDSNRLTWSILMQPVPRYLLDDADADVDADTAHMHSLEWVLATLNPEDWVEFQSRFGVSVQSSYGSTETTIAWTTGGRNAAPVERARIEGPLGGALCGRGRPGWADIRLVDAQRQPVTAASQPGFLEVRGGGLFARYFENEGATADAFGDREWFRTRDYGYIAPSGELYFLNRASGLIRRSGENIAPREIEELLEEHSAVGEAVVIAVEDVVRGEEIAAFVVPRVGATVTEAELFAYCQERLSYFKVPRYIELRAELPHTPTFKVRLDELSLSPAAVDRGSGRPAQTATDPDSGAPQCVAHE